MARTCMVNAESERAFKGRLEPYVDKSAPRPLHADAWLSSMATPNWHGIRAWQPCRTPKAHGTFNMKTVMSKICMSSLPAASCLVSSIATDRMCRARRKPLLGIAVLAGPSRVRSQGCVIQDSFQFMCINPRAPAAFDKRNNLAGRINFMYATHARLSS